MKIFTTRVEAEEHRKSLPADAEKVAKFREEKNRCYAEKEASFQRCDTDGFLSQWASGISGSKQAQKAKLAEHGDHWTFRVLVDVKTGELVTTKLCKLFNKFAGFGHMWKWRVEHDGDRYPEWVTEYKRESNYEKKGYRVAYAVAKAYATLEGEGHGLSGSCWVATKLDRDAEGIEI